MNSKDEAFESPEPKRYHKISQKVALPPISDQIEIDFPHRGGRKADFCCQNPEDQPLNGQDDHEEVQEEKEHPPAKPKSPRKWSFTIIQLRPKRMGVCQCPPLPVCACSHGALRADSPLKQPAFHLAGSMIECPISNNPNLFIEFKYRYKLPAKPNGPS